MSKKIPATKINPRFNTLFYIHRKLNQSLSNKIQGTFLEVNHIISSIKHRSHIHCKYR